MGESKKTANKGSNKGDSNELPFGVDDTSGNAKGADSAPLKTSSKHSPSHELSNGNSVNDNENLYQAIEDTKLEIIHQYGADINLESSDDWSREEQLRDFLNGRDPTSEYSQQYNIDRSEAEFPNNRINRSNIDRYFTPEPIYPVNRTQDLPQHSGTGFSLRHREELTHSNPIEDNSTRLEDNRHRGGRRYLLIGIVALNFVVIAIIILTKSFLVPLSKQYVGNSIQRSEEVAQDANSTLGTQTRRSLFDYTFVSERYFRMKMLADELLERPDIVAVYYPKTLDKNQLQQSLRDIENSYAIQGEYKPVTEREDIVLKTYIHDVKASAIDNLVGDVNGYRIAIGKEIIDPKNLQKQLFEKALNTALIGDIALKHYSTVDFDREVDRKIKLLSQEVNNKNAFEVWIKSRYGSFDDFKDLVRKNIAEDRYLTENKLDLSQLTQELRHDIVVKSGL